MGGCRCSYRSCTSRSDGKTHMFHFPVFDKIRCHQWITNAQKLNFLNLKLSQLKNRVICQHHFKDEDFMNVKKAKLKNTAVPTEDGPYCTKSESRNEDVKLEIEVLPIQLDDIENEYLNPKEKQANYTKKYGDFLINEFPDNINLTPKLLCTYYTPNNGQTQNDTAFLKNYNYESKFVKSSFQNETPVAKYMVHDDVLSNDQIVLQQPVSLNQSKQMPNPTVVSIEFEELNLNPADSCNKTYQVAAQLNKDCTIFPSHKPLTSAPIPVNKKVKIISEKRISEPLKVQGKLEPLSPSNVLRVPVKKKKGNVQNRASEIEDEQQNLNNLQAEYNNLIESTNQPKHVDYIMGQKHPNEMNNHRLEVELENPNNLDIQNLLQIRDSSQPTCQVTMEENQVRLVKKETEGMTDVYTIPMDTQNTLSTDVQQVSLLASSKPNVTMGPTNTKIIYMQPNTQRVSRSSTKKAKASRIPATNKSVLKNKLTPQKLAAIEEKRKFNMKLRDIIDSCLNKLDEEPDPKAGELSASVKRKLNDKNVGDFLSQDPSSQENSIAFMEARLQRMEDTLLNKIDQNSQKILDLKKALKLPIKNKNAFTQTYVNEDVNKKQLYNEISQYLSPEANSLIYEELFINKCLEKSHNSSDSAPLPRKRTKR